MAPRGVAYLAGWTTDLKALAAYASLSGEAVSSYTEVMKAVLYRYTVNEEAHHH